MIRAQCLLPLIMVLAITQSSRAQKSARIPMKKEASSVATQLTTSEDTAALVTTLPALFTRAAVQLPAVIPDAALNSLQTPSTIKAPVSLIPNIALLSAASSTDGLHALVIPISGSENVVAVVRRDETAARHQGGLTRTLVGSLRNRPETQVSLTLFDTTLTGFVRIGDTVMRIISRPSGHVIETEVKSDHKAERPPLIPPKRPPVAGDKGSGVMETAADEEQGCDPVDVGILFVFSHAARGNLSAAAISGIARNGIGLANKALEASAIPHRVHLSGIRTLPANAFRESGNLDTDLNAIHDIRSVREWRNTYKADLVSAWLMPPNGDQDGCGLSWMTNDLAHGGEYGFGVVPTVCALPRLSFVHELGHSFGMDHDQSNQVGTPIRPYARGYTSRVLFSTVEAYECDGGCPRQNYYSNPRLRFSGRPMGIDPAADMANAADDARAASWTMCSIANWHRTDLKVR